MRNWISRIRVPSGFALALLYFYFAQPTWKALSVGAGIAFAGLLIRAWATGHLRKDDQLAVSGPYAFTRNPLYLGSFLLGVGFSVAGRNIWILAVFLICFAALYGNVMLQEVKHLQDLFPGAYAQYKQQVPLFFPRWRAENGGGKFSFDRYCKNREYQALLGFLAALSFLALKIHYW